MQEETYMRQKALAITGSAIIAAFLSALLVTGSWAGKADPQAAPKIATMEFGQVGSAHGVDPTTVEFDRGSTYVLVIRNQSDETHYLVPTAFSDAVKTLSLELRGGKLDSVNTLNPRAPNQLGSVVGSVKEIELRSGGEAAWRFVAMAPGSYQVECGAPSHAAQGMKANIVIR
jgi:uncharacterized cupredoxin-like copper-binding protein